MILLVKVLQNFNYYFHYNSQDVIWNETAIKKQKTKNQALALQRLLQD